ncbi:MAG: GNAT family N-acetyltransferase [Ginsengibacter sp.]
MNGNFIKISALEKGRSKIELIELTSDSSLVGETRNLLSEYGHYMYGDLAFVAGKERFFRELVYFPGPAYLPPSGTFIAAKVGNEVAGCAGIRKFDENSCEMKRMYIRPVHRGKGIGALLCNYVIAWCRKSAYSRILLDSNKEMEAAVALYHKCGFTDIQPYCINENENPVFMEYVL